MPLLHAWNPNDWNRPLWSAPFTRIAPKLRPEWGIIVVRCDREHGGSLRLFLHFISPPLTFYLLCAAVPLFKKRQIFLRLVFHFKNNLITIDFIRFWQPLMFSKSMFLSKNWMRRSNCWLTYSIIYRLYILRVKSEHSMTATTVCNNQVDGRWSSNKFSVFLLCIPIGFQKVDLQGCWRMFIPFSSAINTMYIVIVMTYSFRSRNLLVVISITFLERFTKYLLPLLLVAASPVHSCCFIGCLDDLHSCWPRKCFFPPPVYDVVCSCVC